jgi:hypothetical protein
MNFTVPQICIAMSEAYTHKTKDTNIVMICFHVCDLFRREINDADFTRVQTKCKLSVFLVERELAGHDQTEK